MNRTEFEHEADSANACANVMRDRGREAATVVVDCIGEIDTAALDELAAAITFELWDRTYGGNKQVDAGVPF